MSEIAEEANVTKNIKKISAIETEYTAAEFAAASKNIFGKEVMPECVIAAFRIAGVSKATKTKAKEIVLQFMKKEVR